MQSARFPGIERFIVKSAGNSRSNLILIVVDLSARSTVVLSVTTSCRCCVTSFRPTARFRCILTGTQVAQQIVNPCGSGFFRSSGLFSRGFFGSRFLISSGFLSCRFFISSGFFRSGGFFCRSFLGGGRFFRSIGSRFLLCFLRSFFGGFRFGFLLCVSGRFFRRFSFCFLLRISSGFLRRFGFRFLLRISRRFLRRVCG